MWTCGCVCETYVLLELEGLVHFTGESVDEEATSAVSPSFARLGTENGIHRILEQLNGDLHRHDLSLTDVPSNKVAKLRVWAVLFGAQEVSSGEMRKVVLLDKEAALCSFP